MAKTKNKLKKREKKQWEDLDRQEKVRSKMKMTLGIKTKKKF